MMAAFFPALLLLYAQPVVTVTYRSPGKPVGAILREISTATGLHLRADAEANREIVLVSVQKVPLRDVLNGIASVTSCKWREAPSGRVLEPDIKKRGLEEEDVLRERAEQIRLSIQKQLASIEAPPTKPEIPDDVKRTLTQQELAKLSDEAARDMVIDPGDRATNLILSTIDPLSLASIGLYGRAVWATNIPTGCQGPLPDGAAQAILDWIRQHNIDLRRPSDPATADLDPGLSPARREELLLSRSPVTQPPAKAILIVSSGSFDGSLQAELNVYDSAGAILIHDRDFIQIARDLPFPVPKQEKSPEPRRTELTLSDDSKLLRGSISRARLTALFAAHPGLRERLMHPETKDPLAYVASDLLLSLSESRHRQVIADIPDSFLGIGPGGPASRIKTVEDLEALLSAGTSLREQDRDGILLIGASLPSVERALRIERKSLRELIAAVEAGEQPLLDPISAYALENPAPLVNSLEKFCARLLPRLYANSFLLDPGNWVMCRLYATLSQSQRATLLAGQPVEFSLLGAEQKGYVSSLLFGADAVYRTEDDPPDDPEIGSGGDRPSYCSDLSMEPTEAMPQGLPPQGYITCEISDQPVFQVQGSGVYEWICFSPRELASLEDYDPGAPGFSGVPIHGVLGNRSLLRFTFHVAPGICSDRCLFATQVPNNGRLIRLDHLPESFRFQVDQQRAQITQTRDAGSLDAEGGGTPPPR
jgi:hypothetical protein